MSACRPCVHPNRDQIDRQLVDGIPYRTIGARFDVSLGSLSRHKAHVVQLLKERAPAEREEHGHDLLSDLLARVERVVTKTEEVLATAKAGKHFSAAIGALNALTRQLELIGKLSGGLPGPGGLTVHYNANNTVINNYDGSDMDLATAVAEATKDFDPNEIQRLRLLVAPGSVQVQDI
jgi:hypothetical protein